MAVVINTNFSATVAANNLSQSNAMLQKSLNRLSSGSKIVSPADDAGGLAVASKIAAAAKRSGAAATNISNAISFLQTQDGALKTAGKILDRLSELKTLSLDPTKNSSDKANYGTEYSALITELQQLSVQKFNGTNLYGSAQVMTSEDGVTSSVTLTSRDTSSWTSSLSDIDTDDISAITGAIEAVATQRAENGAQQSRLTFASEMLVVNKTNLEAAVSRIMDVDVAEESTQLARYNVLVQSGTAMLSQANQSPQMVLKLIS
jgi:flagellin